MLRSDWMVFWAQLKDSNVPLFVATRVWKLVTINEAPAPELINPRFLFHGVGVWSVLPIIYFCLVIAMIY